MNVIYYFTGTGNTLFAAKKFAEAIGGAELIPIASLDRSEEVVFPPEAETVGIFSPVYCFGIPSIVGRMIERMKAPGRKVYTYCFLTSGGMKGYASQVLQEYLKRRGIALDGAFHVKMPSNYIPFSSPPSEERCQRLYKNAEQRIQYYAQYVLSGKKHRPIHVFPFDLVGELVARNAVSYLGDYDKYFWITEDCNGCELCEKICPASNIIIMNGMPTWRGHCEQCMACLQWCPKQAIQFKQITQKRKRYHHPDISAEELIRKDARD